MLNQRRCRFIPLGGLSIGAHDMSSTRATFSVGAGSRARSSPRLHYHGSDGRGSGICWQRAKGVVVPEGELPKNLIARLPVQVRRQTEFWRPARWSPKMQKLSLKMNLDREVGSWELVARVWLLG